MTVGIALSAGDDGKIRRSSGKKIVIKRRPAAVVTHENNIAAKIGRTRHDAFYFRLFGIAEQKERG